MGSVLPWLPVAVSVEEGTGLLKESLVNEKPEKVLITASVAFSTTTSLLVGVVVLVEGEGVAGKVVEPGFPSDRGTAFVLEAFSAGEAGVEAETTDGATFAGAIIRLVSSATTLAGDEREEEEEVRASFSRPSLGSMSRNMLLSPVPGDEVGTTTVGRGLGGKLGIKHWSNPTFTRESGGPAAKSWNL